MIKTLQKKFIMTAMAAITVLIFLLLGAINIANVVIVRNDIDETLRIISENDGDPGNIPNMPSNMPPSISPMQPKNEHDKLLSSNFFLVRFDTNGNIVFVDVSRIATIEESDAKEAAMQIYSVGQSTGKIGKFRFSVTNSRTGAGKTAVFLDTSEENLSYFRVLFLSAGIGIICWILMLLLVILLSRKAIRPIAENMERQKQFVTNAGHEIKTPLAIIQANTDAIELYNGENKWSKNIKEQVDRLNRLMKNLLMLARMDEGAAEITESDFSLSELLSDSVHTFTESMLLKGITLQTKIQEAVILHADREQIAQLISILLDNAVKYTNENGSILIHLKKTDKKVMLQVQNTCSQLPDVSPNKLFDRFYRADKARTQKAGGYGIGLSVAKSIAEMNKGNITAEYKQTDRIVFTITF